MNSTPPKIELSPNEKIFYLHIPKTGGTSFVSVLDNFFDQKEICQAYSTSDLNKIPLPQLAKYRFFRGHIYLDSLLKLLTEKPQVISLIRNPQEHAISMFAYMQRKTYQEYLHNELNRIHRLSLEEYLFNPWLVVNRDYRNYQTKFLTARIASSNESNEYSRSPIPITSANLDTLNSEAAFKLVEGFKFVGLLERFEDSLFLLSYVMGWQPLEIVPFLNKGANRPERENILPAFYDQIARNSPLDVALYRLTQQLFEKRFNEMIFDLLERYASPYQSRLKLPLPSAEIFNLLEKNYRKTFAERNKPVTSLHYKLDQPLAGRQWHERNINQEHGLNRWSGPGTHSTLDFPLAAESDLKVKFQILATVTPDVLDSLKLDIDGLEIILIKSKNPDSSTIFEGVIPVSLLQQNRGLTRLNFRVNRTVVPGMVDSTNKDPRLLGINLNWIEFYPVNQPQPALITPPLPPRKESMSPVITDAKEKTSLHLLVIADVSNATTYHLGDEAMLEANLEKFRELWPDIHFSVISHDPQWTAQHYKVAAIKPFGFSNQAADIKGREALLQIITENAEQKISGQLLADQNPGKEIIETLAEADGLIISGGGNLCSSWPGYLYERVALLRLANLFQKPAFVLGQTIGPQLTSRERQLIQETTIEAKIVGVREHASLALAQSLGINLEKIIYQLDDAFYLKKTPSLDWSEQLSLSSVATRPLIMLTLASFAGLDNNPEILGALAEQLEEIAFSTGAGLVFVPHLAGAVENSTVLDGTIHTQLTRFFKAGTPVLSLKTGMASEVRWLTTQADLVISMRYHPLVFAMSANKPGLGIYTDAYTKVKLQGALAHAGLEQWSMPIEMAMGGCLVKAVLELWNAREDIKNHLTSLQPAWENSDKNRWLKIFNLLDAKNETARLPVLEKENKTNQDFLDKSSAIILPADMTKLKPTGAWTQSVKFFEWQLDKSSYKIDPNK